MNSPDESMSSGAVPRRALLHGGAALTVGAGLAGAGLISVLTPDVARAAEPPRAASAPSGAAPTRSPLPPVVRSRQALTSTASVPAGLPITHGGVTYEIAQEAVWLDADHFAVGRWDGTLSVFAFETAQYVGPLIQTAVNTPADQGVEMVTALPGGAVVTSNDAASLTLWVAPRGDWSRLCPIQNAAYPTALGSATNGVWLGVGSPTTLVVGHVSGDLSLWSYDPDLRRLRLLRTVAVQNPNPVNPWGSHVIYGLTTLIPTGQQAAVVAGSDDGYVSLVAVPSGRILSQTVFNPAAQRGINSVSVSGTDLLVTNCSVGAADKNLWYFRIDPATWQLTLRDSANLIVDTSLVQSFNFDTVWGASAAGRCWFGSTEEGLVWMGTATPEAGIQVTAQESLVDGAFGAALAYRSGPGRLVAVIGNLYQFVTGA